MKFNHSLSVAVAVAGVLQKLTNTDLRREIARDTFTEISCPDTAWLCVT